MREVTELSHVTRPLPDGGSVLVLDTGALIKPEVQAMLGARYSRSAKGALALLDDLFDRDVGKFMRENYQTGYGHKSIAELGDAAIFIDGVSMLAAKAIQDFPLYRGQESSTRYIDFSKQRFADPAIPSNMERSNSILEGWRAFYLKALDAMIPVLKERYPFDGTVDESEKVWEKAIKARAFDTARCFLPAGATTNVAWVGDLRHINDHLATLRNHPLREVRGIALAVEDALIEKFPDSFSAKRYDETEKYLKMLGEKHTYLAEPEWPSFKLAGDDIHRSLLDGYFDALTERPPKAELPFSIRECGMMRFEFTLDFGSFRDLQRQRAIIVPMPLLTDDLGFEGWYLNELPENWRKQAEVLIAQQLTSIHMLDLSAEERQYYLPMGMKVPIQLAGDLRGLVYFVELRVSRHVHPTLSVKAARVAGTMKGLLERDGLVLHLDKEPGRFDSKRGTHDIIRKE